MENQSTPTELAPVPTAGETQTFDNLARRLWSCPRCGAAWVEFHDDQVRIVSVRARERNDPPASAVVCLRCHGAVRSDGTLA